MTSFTGATSRKRAVAAAAATLSLGAALLTGLSAAGAAATTVAAKETATTTKSLPLTGVTIALDPGHQLGNHLRPSAIARPVPAGGFSKPCNTEGAMTRSGVREPTVVWRISQRVRTRLEALGATVRMTRSSNVAAAWGPCVDARGRFGGQVGARMTVSLHADGARSYLRGFHVIAPVKRSPWTTRTAGPSLNLAKDLRSGMEGQGFARSTYIGGGTALSIRSDLATLNLSTVPVAMVEIGNMRNPGDAHAMTHARGQNRYADAVVTGIRKYLQR